MIWNGSWSVAQVFLDEKLFGMCVQSGFRWWLPCKSPCTPVFLRIPTGSLWRPFLWSSPFSQKEICLWLGMAGGETCQPGLQARTLRSEFRWGLSCVSTSTGFSPTCAVTSRGGLVPLAFALWESAEWGCFWTFPPQVWSGFLALLSAGLFTNPVSSVHTFILLLSSRFPDSSSLWDYDSAALPGHFSGSILRGKGGKYVANAIF